MPRVLTRRCYSLQPLSRWPLRIPPAPRRVWLPYLSVDGVGVTPGHLHSLTIQPHTSFSSLSISTPNISPPRNGVVCKKVLASESAVAPRDLRSSQTSRLMSTVHGQHVSSTLLHRRALLLSAPLAHCHTTLWIRCIMTGSRDKQSVVMWSAVMDRLSFCVIDVP